MKRDTLWGEIKLNIIEFMARRGILFGRYTKKANGGRDFYPYFKWEPKFKSIPLLFGNLYLLPSSKTHI